MKKWKNVRRKCFICKRCRFFCKIETDSNRIRPPTARTPTGARGGVGAVLSDDEA